MALKGRQNVVQLFGFCFDAPDGKIRIVMELCSLGSLEHFLKSLTGESVRVVSLLYETPCFVCICAGDDRWR